MARILIGNIKGPKGDTGPKGATGATGPVGPQGPLPALINNALATQAGVAALDAAMGKTLGDQISTLNRDIAKKYTVFSAMPSDADSVLSFSTRYPNAIAPYNGLNWGDMPSGTAGYWGRIESRGYNNADSGGTVYFHSNKSLDSWSRQYTSTGWQSDWVKVPTGDFRLGNAIKFEVSTPVNGGLYLYATTSDGTQHQLAATSSGLNYSRKDSDGSWVNVWTK